MHVKALLETLEKWCCHQMSGIAMFRERLTMKTETLHLLLETSLPYSSPAAIVWAPGVKAVIVK